MTHDARRKQIATLQKRIEELSGRLPAHSVKPSMFQQLEQLQDELENLLGQEAERKQKG